MQSFISLLECIFQVLDLYISNVTTEVSCRHIIVLIAQTSITKFISNSGRLIFTNPNILGVIRLYRRKPFGKLLLFDSFSFSSELFEFLIKFFGRCRLRIKIKRRLYSITALLCGSAAATAAKKADKVADDLDAFNVDDFNTKTEDDFMSSSSGSSSSSDDTDLDDLLNDL